jgi:creatinine amidohydrolase
MPPEPDTELELEYMTWTDVRDHLAEGYQTVVFAVGATEQHGPHLPIATDAIQGWATAVGVARTLGKALVAPTIRPGISPHHMDFPGTMTLRHETLANLIIDYCTSLASHGFRTVVVLSAHGGNHDTVRLACRDARSYVKEGTRIVPICDLPSYGTDPAAPKDPRDVGYHAARGETSRMLHLAPDLVHMERARDWTDPFTSGVREVGSLLAQASTRHFAPDGTMGLPSSATAEVGRDIFERRVKNVAEQVRLFLAQLEEREHVER